jgi:signal transduction histidine kinase
MWRLPSDVGPGADIRDLAERVRDQLAEPDAFITKVVELYGDSAREGFDVLRFKDGRVFERYSVPQRAGGEICGRVCSFRDVTQREQLLARLDAIREEERRLIAREIHDQIGQSLTALKLDVAWLRSKAATPGAEVDARAAAMESLIDHTIDTAQRVSTALRPSILDDLGLAAALRWQVREFEQRTGLPCVLDLSSDDTTIEPATALGLFRIAQEALTNVARHAGARQVRVDLDVGAELAALTVADDGRGVTPEELARPTSLGLLGMRERALVVGGQVTIVGTPGKGTTLTARVPVRGAAARS